jgi:hypothetical protein
MFEEGYKYGKSAICIVASTILVILTVATVFTTIMMFISIALLGFSPHETAHAGRLSYFVASITVSVYLAVSFLKSMSKKGG